MQSIPSPASTALTSLRTRPPPSEMEWERGTLLRSPCTWKVATWKASRLSRCTL